MQSLTKFPEGDHVQRQPSEKSTLLDGSFPSSIDMEDFSAEGSSEDFSFDDSSTALKWLESSAALKLLESKSPRGESYPSSTDVEDPSRGYFLNPNEDFSNLCGSKGSNEDFSFEDSLHASHHTDFAAILGSVNDDWASANAEPPSVLASVVSSSAARRTRRGAEGKAFSGSTTDPTHTSAALKWLESKSPRGASHPSCTDAQAPGNTLEAHQSGVCKPCKYVTRKSGCFQGDECAYCHFKHMPGHPGTNWRPSKKKRQMCKDAISQVTVTLPSPDGGEEPRCDFGTLPPSISNNPHLMKHLTEKAIKQALDLQAELTYRV